MRVSVLLLDPFVLAAYAIVAVYAWLVWRGAIRWWFGRDAGWTAVAWPLPAVSGALPAIISLLSALASVVGVREDGMVGTTVYLLAGLVPWAWLCVFPPRWCLPGWARARLTAVPPTSSSSAPGGPASPANAATVVPAVHARRGHGSAARWAWRVDGVAGYVTVDADTLRFRTVGTAQTEDTRTPSASEAPPGRGSDPADHGTGPPSATAGRRASESEDELMARLAAELGFASDTAPYSPPVTGPVPPPSVGARDSDRIDVALTELCAWKLTALRPWAADGLLTLELPEHEPVRLWVGRVGPVRRRLRARTAAAEGVSRLERWRPGS